MPRYIPVRGLVGHALVHKAEPGIVVDKPVLAGQHKTFAVLFLRVSNSLAKQRTCIPAICRQYIDAENHLPRAVLVVHGGVLVHLIGQVRVIGDKTICIISFTMRSQPLIAPTSTSMFCSAFPFWLVHIIHQV